MIMVMKSRIVAAGRFKAQCLALLDEVADTGIALVVTKRGKPVARVVPMQPDATPDLRGSVVREGDLVSPIASDWSADR
jgi:prevent-host-death family protein